MAAPDFLLISNPVSGGRKAIARAEAVLERLRAAGRSAEPRTTQARGDARRLAAQAMEAGTGTIVACGGDGTIQEIASALAGSNTSLGFLPCGRCNDFARAFGLRRSDSLEKLTGLLLSPQSRLVDLGVCESLGGRAEKRMFCSVATLGFDSRVNRYVEERKSAVKGTAAYLCGVLRVLLRFKPPLVKLKWDSGAYEGRILLAATGNTEYYGGGMKIAAGAVSDDGQFRICLAKSIPRRTVLRLLPKLFSGKHVTHPAVRMIETREAEIETPEGAEWVCADGEALMETPVRMKIMHKVLRVKA